MKSVAILTTLLAATAAAHAGPITAGHLDLDIDYSGGPDGALTLGWKTYNPMSAGTPINDDNYPTTDNLAIVPLGNAYVVPSSASFACLGAAGSTVYRLKQSQDAGQIWLGYNTQNVAADQFVDNKVQLKLVGVVEAPADGRFVLYTTNAVGTPTYLFNTVAGACGVTAFPGGGITTNIHNHAWWAFSAPGVYTLRFAASGTLTAANGGAFKSSGNVDVTFDVR